MKNIKTLEEANTENFSQHERSSIFYCLKAFFIFPAVFRIRPRIQLRVFGPPGSGSLSRSYGSGSFHHQAKTVRKAFIYTVCDFFFMAFFPNQNVTDQENCLPDPDLIRISIGKHCWKINMPYECIGMYCVYRVYSQ
jgi:hypothetical protein